MQFKLYFSLREPLSLLINYQSAVQGFLYHMLATVPEYSEFLHELGYEADERAFKLFVFGQLEGRCRVKMPYITFYDQIAIEVRSPMPAFCEIFYHCVMAQDRYELNHQELDFLGCVSCKRKIEDSVCQVRMLSPLTVSTTYYDAEGSRKTRYFAPQDEDFPAALNQNMKNKWLAATGAEPERSLIVTPLKIGDRDKFVTRFAGRTYITGWHGVYQLEGPPDVLTFLYDAGLGSRNSQGFGLFERMNH